MRQREWVGQSVERVEDAALLTGRGRFIDDLGAKPGMLHAAILRSPHAHADIVSIDTAAARASPGVADVITASELADITAPLVAGVGAAIRAAALADSTASLVAGVPAPIAPRRAAVETVRYVGEPVAVVVAAYC